MSYRVLALDYDGTIATLGRVAPSTWGALDRFRERGGRLVLVTGREQRELDVVCERVELFEMVVAENGAVMYRPREARPRVLAGKAPAAFVDALMEQRVEPMSVGEVVVAVPARFEREVRRALADAGLDWCLIPNKESLMVLPPGVNKGTGLARAIAELGVGWGEVVGVGDAENDLDFLTRCGLPVAVANALPEVRAVARLLTSGAAGRGVEELLEMLERDGGLGASSVRAAV